MRDRKKMGLCSDKSRIYLCKLTSWGESCEDIIWRKIKLLLCWLWLGKKASGIKSAPGVRTREKLGMEMMFCFWSLTTHRQHRSYLSQTWKLPLPVFIASKQQAYRYRVCMGDEHNDAECSSNDAECSSLLARPFSYPSRKILGLGSCLILTNLLSSSMGNFLPESTCSNSFGIPLCFLIKIFKPSFYKLLNNFRFWCTETSWNNHLKCVSMSSYLNQTNVVKNVSSYLKIDLCQHSQAFDCGLRRMFDYLVVLGQLTWIWILAAQLTGHVTLLTSLSLSFSISKMGNDNTYLME